ncbi:zinc-binding alcohol dehydrogenase [Roseomonas aerophila]|uniref:Zinc-binding alcohol dehydrogenase n=1 Tax=Teichococcus aerophilus TaxID=1224513 RepID=A0ABR7RRX5_9PROT|nr:zinc-binding alcohol dehydrogenase [Pseudoroseomonas aerophila]
MRARAFWATAPGQGEIREETLPTPGPHQVLVRCLASGISRGTERLVFNGHVPPSQWGTMRAPLQAGEFSYPVKYGYAAVGTLADSHRVFVLHPHQDLFLAPREMCIPVPEGVPTQRAVLAANMETAVNILWDARPLPGERVLVLGAGVVGLLAAWLLGRIPGTVVTVVDTDLSRRAVVDLLGLNFATPDEAPLEQELIVHTSATEAGLRQALHCAAFEGRILEASWHGDRQVALPLGEAFHVKRLQLLSTQVGSVAPAMCGRRSYAERMALALSLLKDPVLDALCGPVLRFDELPARMAKLLGPAAPGEVAPLCPVVTY